MKPKLVMGILAALVLGLVFAACGGDEEAEGSHTLNLSGVMHHPGNTDPLHNCTGCHGSDLKGGSGPSCYSCHSNTNHTINRTGVMHHDGDASVCNACHGPANAGGLGPACSTCHP